MKPPADLGAEGRRPPLQTLLRTIPPIHPPTMTVVPTPHMRSEIVRLADTDPLAEADEWRWRFLALLAAHLLAELETRRN